MKKNITYSWAAMPYFMMLIFIGCSHSDTNAQSIPPPIDHWVSTYLGNNEKLLCKLDVNNEYFFIATTEEEKLKAGIRIDVTSGKMPMTSLTEWHFQNEKGGHLTVDKPPNVVKRGYVRSGNKVYLEGIEYQTLNLKNTRKLQITVNIKKCPASDCDRQRKGKDETEYSIKLCEISLQ